LGKQNQPKCKGVPRGEHQGGGGGACGTKAFFWREGRKPRINVAANNRCVRGKRKKRLKIPPRRKSKPNTTTTKPPPTKKKEGSDILTGARAYLLLFQLEKGADCMGYYLAGGEARVRSSKNHLTRGNFQKDCFGWALPASGGVAHVRVKTRGQKGNRSEVWVLSRKRDLNVGWRGEKGRESPPPRTKPCSWRGEKR